MTVRQGYVDPSEQPVYFDGAPAVLLAVEMQAGEDIVAVGEELRATVAAFEAAQP